MTHYVAPIAYDQYPVPRSDSCAINPKSCSLTGLLKHVATSSQIPFITVGWSYVYSLRRFKSVPYHIFFNMSHEPIGLQLSKVHKFLARELEAFSSEEIRSQTGVDIENSPDILLSLNGDASKVIREKDGRWRWASKYQLTNFNHLISLIARSFDGVCEKDLYDSYKGVRDDIKKLKSKHAVHEIKIGSRVLLFPKNHQLQGNISNELKEKYKRIILHEDEIETHRYLVANGLKNTDDKTGVKIAQPISRKRPGRRGDKKKRNKKIKLTNTHLNNPDIDLTKEYNTGKDSAFN